MNIKYKRRSAVELIADICYIIFLTTEILFRHSAPAQFGLILLTLSSILLSVSKKRINISYYHLISLFFILYNIANVYVGLSINRQASLTMIRTLFLNLIVMWALYNYIVLRKDPNQTLKTFFYANFLTSVIVVLSSISSLLKLRLGSSLGINSNFLSIIISTCFVISFFLLTVEKKRIYYFYAGWFFIIVLLTGSRKGILMVLLGSLFLMFLLKPNRKTKQIIFGAIAIVIFIFLTMNVTFLYEMIGSKLEALIAFGKGADIEEGSLRSRIILIERGWAFFLENPLRGYGLDSYRYLPRTFGNYSHNNFIEILVSCGIIGFLLYYVNHLIAFLRSYKYRDSGDGIIKLMISINIIFLINEYGLVSYYGRPYISLLVMMIAFTKIYVLNKKSLNQMERCDNYKN